MNAKDDKIDDPVIVHASQHVARALIAEVPSGRFEDLSDVIYDFRGGKGLPELKTKLMDSDPNLSLCIFGRIADSFGNLSPLDRDLRQKYASRHRPSPLVVDQWSRLIRGLYPGPNAKDNALSLAEACATAFGVPFEMDLGDPAKALRLLEFGACGFVNNKIWASIVGETRGNLTRLFKLDSNGLGLAFLHRITNVVVSWRAWWKDTDEQMLRTNADKGCNLFRILLVFYRPPRSYRDKALCQVVKNQGTRVQRSLMIHGTPQAF